MEEFVSSLEAFVLGFTTCAVLCLWQKVKVLSRRNGG